MNDTNNVAAAVSTGIPEQVFDELTHSPSWILLGLFLMVVGFVLRTLPWFPNRYITLVCVLLGAFVYPFVTPCSMLNANQPHPQFVLGMIGMIIGFASWIFHGPALTWLQRKFHLEKLFPESPNQNPPADPPATH